MCDRRDLDMWLTPNHRCVIRRRHPQTRKYLNPVIVRADELKPSHSIPTAANWLYEGVEPISSDWAELLGWYIAEGYESKHSMAVEIYQSPSANPEKTKRIEELFQRVEAEYTSATGTRKWRGMDSSCTAFRVLGYAAVRLRELSPKKAIPPDVLLWSDHLIEAILKGLIEGDGHERPDGRSVFVQKSEQAANMVQAMVLRLGMSATCSIRADGIRQVYITKHRTRSFRDSGGEYQTSRESYTGILWCPKTPNGTWVARRNGRAFITGNTFPDELPRRCILAGTSERGVCGECGAPWTRVVERTSMEIKRSERTHPMGRTRSSGTMTKPPSSKTLGWRLATLAWKMAESRRPAVRSSGREALASSPSSSTLISCVDPMSGGGIGPRKPPSVCIWRLSMAGSPLRCTWPRYPSILDSGPTPHCAAPSPGPPHRWYQNQRRDQGLWPEPRRHRRRRWVRIPLPASEKRRAKLSAQFQDTQPQRGHHGLKETWAQGALPLAECRAALTLVRYDEPSGWPYRTHMRLRAVLIQADQITGLVDPIGERPRGRTSSVDYLVVGSKEATHLLVEGFITAPETKTSDPILRDSRKL